MKIKPLGDQAALVYLPSENKSIALTSLLHAKELPWVIDLVPSYSTIAIFFDHEQINYLKVVEYISSLSVDDISLSDGKRHVIPVCYEFGLDFERVKKYTGLDNEKVIELHTSVEFTVYAIGFCPGFPFLGYLPKPLDSVPRLESPRLKVDVGSVGITGRQTGIYTMERPGGWNIIGKTPLRLVNVEKEEFPIRTGDRIKFRKINRSEYEKMLLHHK